MKICLVTHQNGLGWILDGFETTLGWWSLEAILVILVRSKVISEGV